MDSENVIQLISRMEQAGNSLENHGLNNNEVIRQMEQLVEEFYNLPLKPLECLNIFGATGHGFVHFHICKLLKTSINTHWNGCDKMLLYNKLFSGISDLNNTPYHVQQSYLAVVAYVYKRIRLDGIKPPSIYNFLEDLLSDAGLNDLALSLMNIIVEEYSTWHDADNWVLMKESFENDELMKFFAWYKQLIAKEVSKPCSNPPIQLKKVLENLQNILSWDFSKFLSLSSNFKPTYAWLEILFGEDHFSMFSQLSISLRLRSGYQECLISTLSCASQLATAQVPQELSAQLILSVERFFTEYLQQPNLTDYEIFSLSCILSNLTTFSTPLRVLTSMSHPDQVLSDTFHLMLSLSTRPLNNDSPVRESYSNLIETFHDLTTTVLFCSTSSVVCSYIGEQYVHFSSQIFCSFLRGRVALNEEMDRLAFNDFLYYVGCIGRGSLKDNFLFAVDLLFARSQTLSQLILTNNEEASDAAESLQWLLSVVGYLLVDSMDNGQAELPKEVMRKMMEWPNNDGNPFIKLLQWMEEFIRLEGRVGMGRLLVGLRDCFIELLDKINSAYLMFDENKFDTISFCLFEIFGVDTDSASHVVSVVMNAIHLHMLHWTGERTSVKLFEDFLYNKDKRKLAETSPYFNVCLQQYQQLMSLMQQEDG